MQVAAFVAVVRSSISGKETRESFFVASRSVRFRSGFKYPVAAWQRKQVYHVSCLRGQRRGGPPRQTINCTMWEKGVIAHLPLSSLDVL